MLNNLDVETIKTDVLKAVHSQEPLTKNQALALDKAVNESLSKHIIPDTQVYRVAVYSLAFAVLFSVCFASILAFLGKDIPDIISVIAGAAIGAIAGMIKSK